MPYKDPEAQRQYQREFVRRRREAWLSVNGPCVECRSPADLQVDHIDPSKKITHSIWSWSEARRTKELAKCQVLCRECHKIKTKKDKWRPIPHGTDGGYTSRKCRCSQCCEAHTHAKREWRQRRRSAGLQYT